MSYTDLKITDTDNNKEVANKINTTLDQLNVEIPKKLEADSYIKADDIKAYYLIDYNTKQVTPEFEDHTTTGVFKLCDPVALQEALKNPNTEENSAFLTSVAYIMYGLVFSNPDVLYDKDFEVIDNTYDINHFLRYYTDTLLSKEPLVYKNIFKVDDTTNRVIATVSLNGMVRYSIETCVNAETGNEIGQGTFTIYPINPTIRNTVYDIITSFLNKYVEGEPLTRLTTSFNSIFKIPNIRDIATTNSLIQPAFNAEGMLVYGLYLWDNVYTDVVEFHLETTEYTKADLHKIIETGANILQLGDTGAGTSTIHINGRGVDRNTGLQHIGRLNNYTLLVNIKCSDGNLCYFSLVKSNFIVVVTERLDNYAPYMFGLDSFLIPTVNQPQYIKNSVKYSGYIDLSPNPTIVIYTPKSNSEYLSNTVIMGMDPDSVDNRMILGVNNTHYPAIDLSNKETNTAGLTLNILASYVDSTTDTTTASATAPVYPELGYITNTKLKQEVLGTFLDGSDIYATDIREYAITEDSPINSVLQLPYGKNILWKQLPDVPSELYSYCFPIIYKTKRYMHSAPEVGYVDFYYAKPTSIYGMYEAGNYFYVAVYHPTKYPEFGWHSLKGGDSIYLYDLTYGFTASDDTTYEASTNFLAITPEGHIAKLPKEQLAGLTTVDLSTQVTGQLGEANIANNAITVDKLADSIITTDKIVNSAVTTVKIADNAITATKIADSAVTNTKIADSSVSTAKIADGAITSAKIAAKTITASNIADGNITATQIASNAVTEAKIANSSVTTNKIKDSSISTAKIADGAITSAKIAAKTITASNIADGNITATQIASNAVTEAKIANSSVTTNKIKDSSISTAKIADGAVTSAKIASKTIVAGDIADNTITATQIASNAVTSSELANNAVVEAKIASNAVTTAKIKDASVTDAKISGIISKSHGGLGNTYGTADLVGRIDLSSVTGLSGSVTTQQVVTALASKTNYRGLTTTGWFWRSQGTFSITDLPYNPSKLIIDHLDSNGILLIATPAFASYAMSIGIVSGGTFQGWKAIINSDGTPVINKTTLLNAIKADPASFRAALGLGSLATLNSINLSDTSKTTGILPSSRGGFDYQNYLG